MISHARQQVLESINQTVPDPQMVRALIDTGASISAVDPIALNALGLSPTGEADIHTPSTGSTPVRTPTYDVRIAILAGRAEDLHFISETLQVTAADLTAQGIQVLIGRDILKSCTLFYNGAASTFTLSY